MSSLNAKLMRGECRYNGVAPRSVLIPQNAASGYNGSRLEHLVSAQHRWGDDNRIQQLSQGSQTFNPQYLANRGTMMGEDYLGVGFMRNDASEEAVQTKLMSLLQNGGLESFEEQLSSMIADRLGVNAADVAKTKRKRASRGQVSGGVMPVDGQGLGTIPDNEPLSMTNYQMPQSTSYEEVSRNMLLANPMDEAAKRGVGQHVPQSMMLRDQWNGNMVRVTGQNRPTFNPATGMMEVRHETDPSANMSTTSSPYWFNRYGQQQQAKRA